MPTVEETQNAIIDLFVAQGVQIWEETIPANTKPAQQLGRMVPYILISFGGQSPVAQPFQGITSSRDDLKWTSIGTECVGETPADRRAISRVVRETLEGLVPAPGWGQLREQLSDSYTVKAPEHSLWPVRFATGIVFNTQVDHPLDLN